MSSTGALALAEVPERLLVIGGGYVGLELGTVYASLGSRVSLVETAGGLLPGVDRDLVKPLQRRLSQIFKEIRLNARVAGLEETGGSVAVRLEGEAGALQEEFDRVLVAIGRTPATGGVGIENTGVRLDPRGFVLVDEHQRTADEHIFAVGDVVGGMMLAHKASYEG
jgi:dihydrolipoamide dehydrogenase